MVFSFSQFIDAFNSFAIRLNDASPETACEISRIELFTGQVLEEGVLYLADAASSSSDEVEAGAGGCVVARGLELQEIGRIDGLTAAQAANVAARYIARLEDCLDAMRNSYFRQRNLPAFCQALSDFVGNPVVAYDDTLLPAAQSDIPREIAAELFFGSDHADRDFVLKTIPDWKREDGEDVFARREAKRISNHDGTQQTAACNVLADGEFRGYIEIFQVNKPITDGEMHVLEEACNIAAASPYSFVENGFLVGHLEGRTLSADLTASWLKALKWRPDDGVYVIVIELGQGDSANKLYVDHVVRMMRLIMPSSVSQQMGEVCAVVANDRLAPREKALKDIEAFFHRTGKASSIGASEVTSGIASLHKAFEHAKFASKLAGIHGAPSVVRFEDCRFEFFSELCDLAANASLVLDDRVARMHADDEATGSENTLTLKTFIETGLNLTATAEALSVHRNTVAYRLRQLAERYGIDLSTPVDDSDLIFELLLSCKIALLVHK